MKKMKKLFLPFQPNFPFIEATMESFDIYGFLNCVVERVNELQDIVESFDIEEVEKYLQEFSEKLKNEIDTDVNLKLDNFEIEIKNDVQSYLSNYITYFNSQLNVLRDEVDEKIEQIELGEIDVFNPMTGQIENINIVINSLYDLLRNGITATKFDSLEMSATYFDSLNISAYEFDYNSNEILE